MSQPIRGLGGHLVFPIFRKKKIGRGLWDLASWRGGLLVTLWPITLAIRVRFPVGAVRRKSVRVLRWFFISRLPSPSQIRGEPKGLVETGELSVFALFPVTRHNKELVEAQPWTSRSITHPPAFTAHMHTQVEGGHDREIYTPPLKQEAERATYHAPEHNVPPFWGIG